MLDHPVADAVHEQKALTARGHLEARSQAARADPAEPGCALSALLLCIRSDTVPCMVIEVRRTDEFSDWLGGLKDPRARAKAVERLGDGNPGDVGPVGEGISESGSTSDRATEFTTCSAARRLWCSGAAQKARRIAT